MRNVLCDLRVSLNLGMSLLMVCISSELSSGLTVVAMQDKRSWMNVEPQSNDEGPFCAHKSCLQRLGLGL